MWKMWLCWQNWFVDKTAYKYWESPLKTEDKEINSIRINCTLKSIEVTKDLLQLEALYDEQIYACNVCDQEFDKEDGITKHIVEDDKYIMIERSKQI